MSSTRPSSLVSDDIPIDPSLLEEEAAAELAAQDPSDSDVGDSGSEYEEQDEEVLVDIARAGPSRTNKDDAVFDRLAGFVSRAVPTGTSGDFGGRDFQRELELADAEDLPQASRRKTAKPRRVHKPTHEIQRLLGQANMAYIQADYETAIDLFLEVIRQDPYVLASWTTLASCYAENGDIEKARQMKFLGAHIENEQETWRELAMEFRDSNQVEQCIYCLRKALRLDPADVDLLWQLGAIYRQQGQKHRSSDVFKRMLKSDRTLTRDFNFIMDYYPIMIETHQRPFVTKIQREAFDFHIDAFDSSNDDRRRRDPNTMNLDRVIELADGLLLLDDLDQALEVIRRGQRWLQGRKTQKKWDTYEDDREYDPPGTQRQSADGKETEESEGFPLDISLRQRLALVRIKLGDDDEAVIHISEILALDVMQYHSFFLELGDALIQRELWDKALECYGAIQECEDLPDDPAHIYAIGLCQHQLKNFQEAHEALQWVVSNDPENIQARLRLANVLEDMGRKNEALELVSDVIRTRAHREKDSITQQRSQQYHQSSQEPSLTKSERAANKKLTKRVLEDQMRSQMQSLWQDVQESEAGTERGDVGALDQFIQAAGTMIENYRLNRGNFTKSRGVVRVLKRRKAGRRNDLDSQAKEMQDRLERMLGFEDDAPLEGGNSYTTFRRTEFYGLDYEQWLTLMVKYCCVLMVKDEADIAMDILEHVVWSGLFHNRRCEVALRLTIIACAIQTRAYDKIVDNCKRLSQLHQFQPSPLLLLLGALTSGGLKAQAAWSTHPVQSYISREMKTHDDAVLGERLHFSAPTRRWAPNRGLTRKEKDDDGWGGEEAEELGEGDNEDDWGGRPELPKRGSPYLNVLHGQQMITSRSYQSALFYLFRAYELDQYNPFICLLIAQAFFGRSMNRQSDNRNYQIAQGLAFLTRYRKLSPKDAESQEQVEYNYGRSYHGIGVPHLAVVHYERVLESVQKRMDGYDDPEAVRSSSLAYEAAHNLMLIYATSGNSELVREKSKWLAI
ncbi:hypothetical protein CI109_105993 [Kwoniella shandongensis]|uniref:Uncharacterized protein n=1 Tax=Kwoniella shandongensis TaxID=1734106 RepID=A0A5M6BZN3_9TREE|nr:uncharacterized protein CI109_003959 [Kwoniella shandongensis]KAA5527700.1 hypothetical protein CI109_003959 [Kwoniella shandongensis]